jgi:hypothetical protein
LKSLCPIVQIFKSYGSNFKPSNLSCHVSYNLGK